MTVYRSKSKVGVGFAIYDFTAGNDLPLTDPTNHLSELLYHSSFWYYPAAPGFPLNVTINHSSVSPDGGTVVFTKGTFPANITVTSFTQVVETSYKLADHNLGYAPNFMVAVNGVQYPAGCPIQVGTGGARRCVTFYVDSTSIWVLDSSRPSTGGLAAISVTYHVTVFRNQVSIGTKLEDCQAGRIRLGYGGLDTNESMAREPDVGDTVYNIPTDEVIYYDNGCVRFALPDGSMFDLGPMSGRQGFSADFNGGPSKGIAI